MTVKQKPPLKAHLQYLWYVLCHKWFVLLEGLKLELPLWLLIIHDWPKFTRVEWTPYVLNFFVYGHLSRSKKPAWVTSLFKAAWQHHFLHCPHHWEYWATTPRGERSERSQPRPMPDRYRREMLADWRGAGRAINGVDDSKAFYLKRRPKIILHPETRRWVEEQLGIHEKEEE